MAQRRTRRRDGRYSVNARFELSDSTATRALLRPYAGRGPREGQHGARAGIRRCTDPRREPLGERWLTEWRDTFLLASDRAVSTKSLYAGLTLRHVEPVIGQLALGLVRPSDITQVLLRMEQSGRAASTRRNTYAATRTALHDAVADGLLAVNPVLRVKRPRAVADEAVSLSPDEVQALLAGAGGCATPTSCA